MSVRKWESDMEQRIERIEKIVFNLPKADAYSVLADVRARLQDFVEWCLNNHHDSLMRYHKEIDWLINEYLSEHFS